MPLFRIAVIGTKRPTRVYVGGTDQAEVELVGRSDALHWNKREAKILSEAFTHEFERLGLTERFQIEKA